MKFPLVSSNIILGGMQPSWCHRCHVTWPADRGFNACFLQHWHPVDGTFNVLCEYIPVQIKEAKSKFFRYLEVQNKNWDIKYSTAEGLRTSQPWQPWRLQQIETAWQILVSLGFSLTAQPSQRSGAEPELRHLHLDKGMMQQGRDHRVASKSPQPPSQSHSSCPCILFLCPRWIQGEDAVLGFPSVVRTLVPAGARG